MAKRKPQSNKLPTFKNAQDARQLVQFREVSDEIIPLLESLTEKQDALVDAEAEVKGLKKSVADIHDKLETCARAMRDIYTGNYQGNLFQESEAQDLVDGQDPDRN